MYTREQKIARIGLLSELCNENLDNSPSLDCFDDEEFSDGEIDMIIAANNAILQVLRFRNDVFRNIADSIKARRSQSDK